MLKNRFFASFVDAKKVSEAEYFIVKLADRETDPKDYLILQRSFEVGRDDRLAGMDSHYFEYKHEAISGYAVCKSVRLSQNHIDLDISEESSAIFELLPTIHIDFEISALEHQQLQKMIELIFQDDRSILKIDSTPNT